MARLKMAPRKGLTTDLPSHSPIDADAEAATQQLLAESLASSSKLRSSPPPSAVLGASLLNAARIRDRHSSPAGMARKAGAGKLKRPSMVAEEQSRKKNLAPRGDVYDVMLSPEKGEFKLPEMVNRQPLKVVRKNRKVQQEEGQEPSEGQYLSSELPASHDEVGGRGKSRAQEVAELNGTQHASFKSKKGKNEHAPSQKTHPQVQIPVRASRRQKATKGNATEDHSGLAEHGVVSESIEEPSQELPVEGRRTRSKRQATNRKPSSTQHKSTEKQKIKDAAQASKKPRPAPETTSTHSTPVDDEARSGELDADEQQLGSDEADGPEQPNRPSAGNDIDEVLKFLDTEERPGHCQTKFGTTIKRTSERSRVLVQSEDLSINDVVEDFKDIESVLKQVPVEISKHDRLAFKTDAYSYIFRALTAYLEAVYSWLGEKCESVNESLEAVRILSPLTHEILALKDTIAKWDVSVPQRYKGDRIIMDVDSNLIVPLRQLDKSFRVQLYQLEAAEHHRQQRAELKRRREAEADEEQRIAKATEASRERWRRWQILHISRMQCEPDPRRRRRLAITKLEDIEEKDANGVKFERVPLFRARSTPPLHWASSMAEERVWTDDEETALLEGLESFAGPDVFEMIFSTHCRAGGVLRDFNVTEIVTKSAWVRSAYMKAHQEKGWDVPRWVNQIPVLL